MAQYSTVNDLYTDIARYVDTKEQYFISKIPAWIHLAESELDRRLRHPAAENVQGFTVKAGNNYLTAPIDLLELKSVRNTNNNLFLYRRSYETLFQVYNPEKEPVAFASVSNKYILDKPVSVDTIIEVVYYNAPQKLDISNSSNLYLIALPDFLLYVGLEQAFIFNGQPDQATYWRGMAETRLAMLNEQILRESYQGSTLVTYTDIDRINKYF